MKGSDKYSNEKHVKCFVSEQTFNHFYRKVINLFHFYVLRIAYVTYLPIYKYKILVL